MSNRFQESLAPRVVMLPLHGLARFLKVVSDQAAHLEQAMIMAEVWASLNEMSLWPRLSCTMSASCGEKPLHRTFAALVSSVKATVQQS